MGFLESLPIVGGFFDDSDDKAMEIYQGLEPLMAGVPEADLNYTPFRPGDLAYTGDYKPQDVSLKQISTDPQTRQNILQNLSRMQYLADKGLSAEDELGFERARQESEQMAKGREGAIVQNMQARGAGGSGMEAALRAQATQEAANRGRQGAMEQAAASARQKALYTQAYGNALSQFRGDDFGEAAQNAGIANQQAVYNTGNQNQAQLRNLNARQDVGSQKWAAENAAKLRNIDVQNQLAQQRADNAYRRAAGLAGAREGVAQGYLGKGAANAARRRAGGSLIGAGIGALAGGPVGASVGAGLGGAIG